MDVCWLHVHVNRWTLATPVGDLLIPPLLSRQSVAFIPLAPAGVRMIWDATSRPPHPPEHHMETSLIRTWRQENHSETVTVFMQFIETL